MRNYLIVLFLFFSASILAQTTPADSLMAIGQVEVANKQFAIQYIANPDDKENLYNYACALSLSEHIDSAFHCIDLAIIGDTSSRILNDPDFYNLLGDPRWSSLENEIVKRIEEAYSAYKYPEITKELWRMRIKDQAFYYHEEQAINELSRSAIWELKNKLNHENSTRLVQIIEEYGWPKKSDIGGKAAASVFLIIQHADLATQKKYLPLMTEAANNEEAEWSSLAMLIDRINMRENKPQIYGTQIRGSSNGKLVVHEIENPEYVNQRREEVGLGPIEEYIKNWGIEWTIEQKTKSH